MMKRFRVTSASSIVLVMLCIMYFITYPYLVFQIVGGWVSDRFGAKRTLICCGAIWALATILTGLAGGLTSLLAARLLLGFGEGATFPAATAAMARWVAKEKRGFAQGITHAASRIGNAVAPAAIVLVMATWGWRESFYICGVFSLVWVIVWAVTFTEHPKDHPRITADELEVLPQPKPKAANVPWKALFRRMAPVTIVYFCYGWTRRNRPFSPRPCFSRACSAIRSAAS
jgi:ACS family glucarate transporter-like MFS transporter